LLPAAVSGSPCTNLATFENGKLVPKSTEGDGFLHKPQPDLEAQPSSVLLYGTWSRGYRPGRDQSARARSRLMPPIS
jgi:iron complex outermembrane receptor protein